MSHACLTCDLVIDNTETGHHEGHDIMEQSHMLWWYACLAPSCEWEGHDARTHWRDTKHEDYDARRRITKLGRPVPPGGLPLGLRPPAPVLPKELPDA